MSHGKRSLPSSSPPIPSSKRAHSTPTYYPSYTDFPDLPQKIRILCHLLHSTPPQTLEPALNSSSVSITPPDVESVLKLSYTIPAAAVKFLRWAGSRLGPSLSPYSWNLAVDLLGRNRLFDAMWDCVFSMHSQRLLSLATFASVFSSLSAASRFDDALKAFDEMQAVYSVPRDTAALNSLLSALCREGKPAVALDVLDARRHLVAPDPDTYAILLEGWESVGDHRAARKTFEEMVDRIGLDPVNTPAYESYLTTLLKADRLEEAIKCLKMLKEKRCYPGVKFFRNAIESCRKAKDAIGAVLVWDMLIGRNGCVPDTEMYNSMVALQCDLSNTDAAQRLLDEMVTYGVFPDSKTYNVLLEYLLRGRKVKDAATVLSEMLRNELVPSENNCETAVRVFADSEDWVTVGKAWRCLVENKYQAAEESGNTLVVKMIKFDRIPEACTLAEDMIDRKIKLSSASLTRIRTSLLKLGRADSSCWWFDETRPYSGHNRNNICHYLGITKCFSSYGED